MSIKIYTYYYKNNYGALLQSLCLKNFIESHTNKNICYDRYQPKNLMFGEIYRPLITKNFYKFKGVLSKNLKMRKWKKKLGLKKPIYEKNEKNESTLLSIYGSDEIWNFTNAYYGYDQYFFGKNNESKKISYAASFGRSKYELLSNMQKKEIIENLNKFEAISVRDINSANIVKKLTNIEPTIVVDPTLISTPPILENENKLIVSAKTNYALVYGTVFSELQKKKIINYCKENNYKPISIGFMNKWIKNNYLNLDPIEFYQIIKNSKIVFTSMFHGIMFSTKLKKNFWYSVDPIRENKIKHFIDELKLTQRELKEDIDLKKEINYKEVDKILDVWISNSKKFLINKIDKYVG